MKNDFLHIKVNRGQGIFPSGHLAFFEGGFQCSSPGGFDQVLSHGCNRTCLMGCSSVEKHLSSMGEVLGLILRTAKQKQSKTPNKTNKQSPRVNMMAYMALWCGLWSQTGLDLSHSSASNVVLVNCLTSLGPL